MTALFALMLSLVLAACTAAPLINVHNAPPPAAEPERTGEEIVCVIELGTWEDSAAAADGTLLAAYSFVLPVMQVTRADGTAVQTAQTPAEEQALASAEVFNRRFGEWAAAREFEGLVQEAQAALDYQREEGLPWAGGYELELTCSVYQTENLISVSGTYYSNTGGAHPNTWQIGWSFDLRQGTFLEPELLSEGTDLLDAVSAELVRRAEETDGDGRSLAEDYWEDYAAIIANWCSYAVSFNEAGMTVTFSPYELAPYGFGPQSFLLDYDWLMPHLSDYGRALLGLESAPEMS